MVAHGLSFLTSPIPRGCTIAGEPRKPLTPLRALRWTVLAAEHRDARYEVELDFLAWEKGAKLYRDEALVEQRDTPVKVDLDDGTRLEVDISMYGVKYARLVTPDGRIPLQPIPESWEHRWTRWHRDHPAAARAIATASWVVLLVAAILGIPQMLEVGAAILTETDLGERFGVEVSYTSPVALPGRVNTAMTVLAVAAALERGTRMKYRWWLDGMA